MAEPFRAERVNIIVVDHQNQWNLGPGPKACDHGKNRSKRCPTAQGPFCRLLDHGTIGDGIGKRDTQFNDIGTGLF